MAPETSNDRGRSKPSLLVDSDSDSDGGARVEASGFKVNEEFARRFEHNKKREERQRLEEKFKTGARSSTKDGAPSEDDDSSSSSETEDEDGFLATEDLDAQISATLHAIRNKDPRVYDKSVTFVQMPDDETVATTKTKGEKPVLLRDYQRERLLRGDTGASDEEDAAPRTYAEEQDALKKSIVSEIHAVQKEDDSDDDSSNEDSFMKKKEPTKADVHGVHPSRAPAVKVSELDVVNADKNPETFLSNFLASRAWIPEEGGRWKAFESDDEDESDKADEWEEAYNMRFEDPGKSNEFLRSYARDFAAARSVRREEKTGRKRQRELERERKEEEKRQEREEKARLKKLKLEEVAEKLRKVKQAAGVAGTRLKEEEWMQFLNDAWDNDKWEEEMQKRFGDEYYAMEDRDVEASDAETAAGKKKRKVKKPKWEDDIDIKDIIPDFGDTDAKPAIALSDNDDGDDEDDHYHEADEEGEEEEEHMRRPSKKRKTTSDKRARVEAQKSARRERNHLEALVESKLELTEHALLRKASAASSATAGAASFRYRATSPQSFGLTARDILLAPSDQALNEFAGLKKLAPYRDEQKKRKDRKRLGKKARLREWRRGTFGREYEVAGPTYGFEQATASAATNDDGDYHHDQGTAGTKSRPLRKKAAAAKHERSGGEDAKGAAGDGVEGNVVGDVGGARKKKRKRSKGKGSAGVEAS